MENKDIQIQVAKAEEVIKQRIYIIRGQKVMLGQDIAELYQVQVKVLIQAMNRNKDRFPEDFVFQLNDDEYENLKSQFVTSSWGGIRRAKPYAFTEHGVAMLSSILKSKMAVNMSIFIVRAFIKMRESLDQYKDLSIKINDMELEQKEQGILLIHVHSAVKGLINKIAIKKPIKNKSKIDFQIK